MAISTVRDLCTAAMRTTGIIGEIATPTAVQAETALDELNGILDDWNNESLIPFKKNLVSFSTVGAQADYTIGATGDVVADTPTEIKTATIQIDSTSLFALRFESFEDFNERARDVNLSTYPAYYTFNRSAPNATLSLYPIPDGAYTVKLVYTTTMGDYGLDDVITLPKGYIGAMQYALASSLCTVYSVNNPRIDATAAKRKATLEIANYQPNQLNNGKRHQYSIEADRYI